MLFGHTVLKQLDLSHIVTKPLMIFLQLPDDMGPQDLANMAINLLNQLDLTANNIPEVNDTSVLRIRILRTIGLAKGT